MESLSKIEAVERIPLTLPVPGYLMDHRVDGTAVFPAVEAMAVLDGAVRRAFPGRRLPHITQASFDRFLYIEPATPHITAFAEIGLLENGSVAASLLTRGRVGSGIISRAKEHARMIFTPDEKNSGPRRGKELSLGEQPVEIDPERLYRELVPFGPTFQNITRLHLAENGAVAEIRAPVCMDSPSGEETVENVDFLGSPFPLDAAFHAACAWSQRFAETIAFPVGLARRTVLAPTQPGLNYIGQVRPIERQATDELQFEITLYAAAGTLCEIVSGVRMRDISGGKRKPPAWIRGGLFGDCR